MSRNLKLWNHWIAEVRELAAKIPCYFEVDEGEKPVPFKKSDYKYAFNKDTMWDSFESGESPLEALNEEISYWDI